MKWATKDWKQRRGGGGEKGSNIPGLEESPRRGTPFYLVSGPRGEEEAKVLNLCIVWLSKKGAEKEKGGGIQVPFLGTQKEGEKSRGAKRGSSYMAFCHQTMKSNGELHCV